MQYNQGGHNKRTMESDRAIIAAAAPKKDPEVDHCGLRGGLKWDIMDIANRRTLAKVPAIPDMPQAVPAMGSTRRLRLIAQELAQDLYERGELIFGSLHRRNLCAAKKGSCGWQDKTRQGTKIMAIADAAGFPIAAHIESASPHEVKLVEATIDSSFTQYAPDRIMAIRLTTVMDLMIGFGMTVVLK